MARAKRKVAHLALHAARVARIAPRDNPALEDLRQDAATERPPVPRGGADKAGSRSPGVVTPVGALLQKMRTWAGKEGDGSQNGLNHQPHTALPSDNQCGRPPYIASSRQGATGPNAASSLTSGGRERRRCDKRYLRGVERTCNVWVAAQNVPDNFASDWIDNGAISVYCYGAAELPGNL